MNRTFFKKENKQKIARRINLAGLLVLFLCCVSPRAGLAAERPSFENHVAEEKTPEPSFNLENTLSSVLLGDHTLMYYFAISQAEFYELAARNGIEKIQIDIFWEHHSGRPVRKVAADVIDLSAGRVNIETWALTIEDADLVNGRYLLQVTVNDGECSQKVAAPFRDEQQVNDELAVEEELAEEPPVELPAYVCGDPFSAADSLASISRDSLPSANLGDIFRIGGFPILLTSIEGANGTYSGGGVVPLPFGRSVMQVTFENVRVNKDGVIYEGVVDGVQDNIANYPDFNIEAVPLNIGGDICLPPPPPPGYTSEGINEATGLDDWGFDEEGIHGETGTEYDPNGFDQDGNHQDTGTAYNRAGCNREGFTEDGNPCDPGGGPNPAAEALAESIRDTLPALVDLVLDSITQELQAGLSGLNCHAIRDEMESLLANLEYDRAYIFGENDRYFDTTMHLYFSQRPVPLVLNIDRNPDARLLEERHVDLFQCDRSEYALKAKVDAVGQLSGPGLADIILEKIRNWTEYEYGLYEDPAKFADWLRRQVEAAVREQSGLDESYSFARPPAPGYEGPRSRNIFPTGHPLDYYNAMASLDDGPFPASADHSFQLEEAAFYFMQGEERIFGIDRAFYLEELARQQSRRVFADPIGGADLLPVKVEKTVGNRKFTIYLDSVRLTPLGAMLNAYSIIEDPESGKRLVFKGYGLGFGPTGLQGEALLHLATDVEIRLSNAAMLVLKGTPNTYIEWDCKGFKSMGLEAEIEFCRNIIVPLDPATLEPKPDPERYRLAFAVQDIHSWLEFYTVISAPPFAVAGYEDIKWQLSDMVLDFSSTETPIFRPMDGYASPYFDGETLSPAWKGFYMGSLSATFPNRFAASDSTQASADITAEAFDVLIDDSGFTGGVEVQNLIGIEEGSLGGWPFSIDAFQLRILKNHFAGAGLGGEVNVPIFEENTRYTAVMYPGNLYKFSIEPMDTATVDMFLAKASLSKSVIEAGLQDGRFLAVATLNGSLRFDTKDEARVDVQLPEVTFQNFQVSNQAPYFSPGIWGIKGRANAAQGNGEEKKFNGFGVRVKGLQPFSNGIGTAGLGIDLDIELVRELAISAGAGLAIEGRLNTVNGRQRWVYNDIYVDEVRIDASFGGGNHVKGILAWFGNQEEPDDLWGQGFFGAVEAQFKMTDQLSAKVNAAAMFGRKGDYKYFFVDGLADLRPGVGAGLMITGFGGGASYHMDVNLENVSLTNTYATGAGDDPAFDLPAPGGTFSKAQYRPDPTKGLGLRATVALQTAGANAFNGTVSFQVLFTDKFGLDKVSLTGAGQFLMAPDFGATLEQLPGDIDLAGRPASVQSNLSCYVDLSYNFGASTFDGTLFTFLNAPGITGAGPNGRMVDAQIHFGPDKWFIYLGRPEEGQRCGLQVEALNGGGAALDLHAEAYMDIGSDVPPMPPLPARVREIAYLVNDNQSFRRSGGGFVFGASLGFDVQAGIRGIASANLSAEAGFDMMLKNYGGYVCSGSSGEVGIHGWYATGQMYAFVEGALQVFGVNIVQAGIAAVMQARLPNPFWAQAAVGVKLRVLGAKIRKSLKLELGSDCFLISNDSTNMLGMEAISYLDPGDGTGNVPTNARPQAFFALELGRKYSIADINGQEQAYEVKFNSAAVTDRFGLEAAHTLEFGEDGSSLTFIPTMALPGNDSLYFEVKVDVYRNGVFFFQESKTAAFATAAPLDHIPENNVTAAYPQNGMANFYRREYSREEGFIELRTGQPELFHDLPEGYTQRMRLTDASGQTRFFDIQYDGFNNRLTFPLDAGSLVNDAVYRLDIVRLPAGGAGVETGADGPAVSGNAEINADTPAGERSLYSLYFRTSKYDTFSEKMEAVTGGGTAVSNLGVPYWDAAEAEYFDNLETGDGGGEALIDFTVDLNNAWLENDIAPLVDQLAGFLCEGGVETGLIDLEKSLEVFSFKGNPDLSVRPDHLAGGYAPNLRQRLNFGLEQAVEQKLEALRAEAMNCYSRNAEAAVDECGGGPQTPCPGLDGFFEVYNALAPAMRAGTYGVLARYRLPGGITTSVWQLDFVKE